MRTISRTSVLQRLIGVPVLSALAAAPMTVVLGRWSSLFYVLLLALMWWNALHTERRRAYTQAVRDMKPIERADDPTLFPDEVDPSLARPSLGQVLNNFQMQLMVAVAALLLFLAALLAVLESMDIHV